MRIDWPSERAAAGSLRDPNSTMITTATIRIFHGLSNRSPIIFQILLVAGEPGLADEQSTGSSEGRRSAARRNGGGGPPGVRGLTAVKAVSGPGGRGRGSSRGVAL